MCNLQFRFASKWQEIYSSQLIIGLIGRSVSQFLWYGEPICYFLLLLRPGPFVLIDLSKKTAGHNAIAKFEGRPEYVQNVFLQRFRNAQ